MTATGDRVIVSKHTHVRTLEGVDSLSVCPPKRGDVSEKRTKAPPLAANETNGTCVQVERDDHGAPC